MVVRKIRQNDYVKFKRHEPEALGRVIEITESSQIVVQWRDGIVSEHLPEELKIIRINDLSGSWLTGFGS